VQYSLFWHSWAAGQQAQTSNSRPSVCGSTQGSEHSHRSQPLRCMHAASLVPGLTEREPHTTAPYSPHTRIQLHSKGATVTLLPSHWASCTACCVLLQQQHRVHTTRCQTAAACQGTPLLLSLHAHCAAHLG
jgi:hypothetical protein